MGVGVGVVIRHGGVSFKGQPSSERRVFCSGKSLTERGLSFRGTMGTPGAMQPVASYHPRIRMRRFTLVLVLLLPVAARAQRVSRDVVPREMQAAIEERWNGKNEIRSRDSVFIANDSRPVDGNVAATHADGGNQFDLILEIPRRRRIRHR